MKHIITITDKDITGSEKQSLAKPRIAVNAVLFDDDNNIAISYMGKYDLHTLPGGGVEPLEDFISAVKREIWEEAGCECEIIKELGSIFENRYEHDFTQERYYYIAKVVGEKGSLHLTDEEVLNNTTVVWVPLSEALRIISDKIQNDYQEKFIQKRDIMALTEAMKWLHTHDIPGSDTFIKVELVTKGLSSDKKYYVEAIDGKRFILRISDISEYERKKAAFERMKLMDAQKIPMSRPVDFGICNNGKSVYQQLTWCDGDNLEEALSLLPETEQYAAGLKAGRILRKIHAVPILEEDKKTENWNERYSSFIDESIKSFHTCGVLVDGIEKLLDYFNNNRHLLKTRPQCYLHDDYHAGNMMITSDGELSIIDWEIHLFNSYGDPWRDITMQETSHFSTGMINGYFDGVPLEDYWSILAFYTSIGAVSSIPWAYYCYPNELESRLKLCADVLSWFDNMNNKIPTWYLKDFYIQWIDDIPYKLKAYFDFSFISEYGKVFKVYDDQDSGNICFGVTDGKEKYFIKFAGAPTERACVSTEVAIANLKRTVPIYQDLAHKNLINLIHSDEVGGGFMMIFEWTDAECMHSMYPLSRRKFLQMSNETRFQVFDDILNFHAFIIKQGYVAIDFYDGSIMYDFNQNKTYICDIDLFEKAPYINHMGRMWGSSRFMSPEEYRYGAAIDEITTVYTMGATAFALFGDESDRCFEKWRLSRELFEVAKRAVSDEHVKRQQSIKQLSIEWNLAR